MMHHYELTILTARAGTSFFIRAEKDAEAVARVVRIAAAYETVEPAAFELTRNGRRVPCEITKAAGGASTSS